MAEAPITERSVYTARPTVQIDTAAYPLVTELLTALELTAREGGLSALELRLSNVASDSGGGADLAFEDDAILKLGAAITVYAGDELAPQEIFRGVITGLEAEFGVDAPELVVLAEDRLQQARMARRTRTYVDTTVAELARDVAGRLGLQPVIASLDAPIGTQVQLDESDLAFLRRILARYDGDLQVVGNELHVAPRGEVRRGTLDLALHGQLRRARVLADLSQQVTEVSVSGWDARQGQRVSATSTGAHAGPGRGRTGADVLRATLGERQHHVAHLAAATDAEAQAIAAAAFDDRARRFLVVDGVSEGNPALQVGTHVALSGLGARFDNTYYVVRVCHRFDSARGYETDFSAECAFWGAA